VVAPRKRPKAEQGVLLEMIDRLSRRWGALDVGGEPHSQDSQGYERVVVVKGESHDAKDHERRD